MLYLINEDNMYFHITYRHPPAGSALQGLPGASARGLGR